MKLVLQITGDTERSIPMDGEGRDRLIACLRSIRSGDRARRAAWNGGLTEEPSFRSGEAAAGPALKHVKAYLLPTEDFSSEDPT